VRVAQLRHSRRWAQVDLVAESGLDRSYISKIENGHTDVTISTIEIIATSFGMTVSQFMRGV
jgi:transcriptional regulator with XRE-family HTH domain